MTLTLLSSVIGITAGASTPNNKIGATIVAIARTAGLEPELRDALRVTRDV